MSPLGGGKPLFDLISSGKRGGSAASPRRESGSQDHAGQDLSSKTVTLPMIWVYAGIGLVLLMLVAGYGIGYQLGTGSSRELERREAARDAERVFVDDPLRIDQGGGSPADELPDRNGGGDRSNQPEIDRPSTAGAGVLRADGRTAADPRRSGVNYLELVALPREQAIEAVRYLSANGQEAIAVPVAELEPGSRRSNTSASFRVIALGLAVPGEQFRSSADARKRFEDRLARLGKSWAADGGASDFSDPLWRRYGG